MNAHVNAPIAASLHRFWPIPIDVDHFAIEDAKREKARERRMAEHPDPRDPEYPEEEE